MTGTIYLPVLGIIIGFIICYIWKGAHIALLEEQLLSERAAFEHVLGQLGRMFETALSAGRGKERDEEEKKGPDRVEDTEGRILR